MPHGKGSKSRQELIINRASDSQKKTVLSLTEKGWAVLRSTGTMIVVAKGGSKEAIKKRWIKL